LAGTKGRLEGLNIAINGNHGSFLKIIVEKITGYNHYHLHNISHNARGKILPNLINNINS